jgi:hypothetical protein
LDRLAVATQSISDARLLEYTKALPKEWDSAQQVVDNAVEFLGEVRDNIEAVTNEIYKVLA